ncbi:MAG TPA: hypothetical protein VHV54_03815 [Candidatus Binatia bacterium]|nr:hypothetical protein [Candidatus Binatia bacterium]
MFAVCALLFALCSPAEAQQPKKVSRLGYLSPVDAATDSPRAGGIRLALRELGYIEGQNIAIEYRYAEGKRSWEIPPVHHTPLGGSLYQITMLRDSPKRWE